MKLGSMVVGMRLPGLSGCDQSGRAAGGRPGTTVAGTLDPRCYARVAVRALWSARVLLEVGQIAGQLEGVLLPAHLGGEVRRVGLVEVHAGRHVAPRRRPPAARADAPCRGCWSAAPPGVRPAPAASGRRPCSRVRRPRSRGPGWRRRCRGRRPAGRTRRAWRRGRCRVPPGAGRAGARRWQPPSPPTRAAGARSHSVRCRTRRRSGTRCAPVPRSRPRLGCAAGARPGASARCSPPSTSPSKVNARAAVV